MLSLYLYNAIDTDPQNSRLFTKTNVHHTNEYLQGLGLFSGVIFRQ